MLRAIFLTAILLFASPAFAQSQTPESREQITLSFAPVVKRVVPAVVNIYTKHTEKVQASPLLADPFFRELLGAQGFGGMPRERVVKSLGSGVIIGADGTIVTSYHVVKGSEEINVVLSDRREFEGHVQKVDETADLAVVKVDTKGAQLPTLTLRESGTLEVGDLVLAVGNPFGVGQTVTSGIISALARSAAGVSDYEFFIQTDAAINPGNSGGALVDMQGRLIGINTAIYSHTGGYQGIGFAIPADMVRAVLNSKATASGAVIRPWFGVAVQPVTREIADAQGLASARGVLVQQVSPNSPAAAASIRPGDVITSLAGGDVDDSQSLNFRIVTTGIGVPATVEFWRGGKKQTLSVTFTQAPAGGGAKPVTLKGNHPLNGATVAALTPELAEQLHLKASQQGVVVIKAGEQEQFGMDVQTGDIILAVGRTEVHSVQELERQLSGHASELQLTLARGGMVMTMSVVR